MISNLNPGDTVEKLHLKIDGCCGSSLMDSYEVKSVGIYTDTNGRKIPLIELNCMEFFREDQLHRVAKGPITLQIEKEKGVIATEK